MWLNERPDTDSQSPRAVSKKKGVTAQHCMIYCSLHMTQQLYCNAGRLKIVYLCRHIVAPRKCSPLTRIFPGCLIGGLWLT